MPISCAVLTCRNNSDKFSQLSYHRFPKEEDLKNEWIIVCGRDISWNPKFSRICSAHFKDDDFQRDLRHELLGAAPKRKLKEGVVPSLNVSFTATVHGEELDEECERKILIDKIYEDIDAEDMLRKTEIQNILEDYKDNIPLEISQTKEENDNYEERYRNLLNEFNELKQQHSILKNEHQLCKQKLKSFENQVRYYKLKSFKGESKEKELRGILSQVLTKNQLNLLLKKKRMVRWQSEEMATAFTLRCYSKKTYIFLRETLKYPLPSLSSLRRWAMKRTGKRHII